MKDNKFYVVFEGMPNPREPINIGWRYYGFYEDKNEAIKEAKELTIGRVDECNTIYPKPN